MKFFTIIYNHGEKTIKSDSLKVKSLINLSMRRRPENTYHIKIIKNHGLKAGEVAQRDLSVSDRWEWLGEFKK